jgi:ketosteroid isomerase-like protein
MGTGMGNATDIAIRLARASFNRALADKDLAGIGPLLAPQVVLVAGTDSAVITGRKAQLLAWKREFSAAQPCTYVRRTTSVEPSPIAPIAMEHGSWQGTVDGASVAQGSYCAKWRDMGAGQWVIEAEIFVTLG